jgi:hypothetical protein
MKSTFTLGAAFAAALLVSGAFADEPLKSGPQPGKGVSPFNPLHMNGPNADSKLCLV